MDTYVRTVILFVIFVISEVKGQGGGVPIGSWGQGISINMAEFDPFASRRDKPDVFVMDPHDPKTPKFAPEPALVGGGSAAAARLNDISSFSARDSGGGSVAIGMGMPFGGSKPKSGAASDQWSRDNSFTSFSSSSSSSKEISSTKEFRSGSDSTGMRTRPRDSGGVAISLSGPLPGNDSVSVNDIRFDVGASVDSNDSFNASALNVSMFGDIADVSFGDIHNASSNKTDSALYNNNNSSSASFNHSKKSNGLPVGNSGLPDTFFGVREMLASGWDVYPSDDSNNTQIAANATNDMSGFTHEANATASEMSSDIPSLMYENSTDYVYLNDSTTFNPLSDIDFPAISYTNETGFNDTGFNETGFNDLDVLGNSSSVVLGASEPSDLIFSRLSLNNSANETLPSLFENSSLDNSTAKTILAISDNNVGSDTFTNKMTEIPPFEAPGIVGPTVMPSFSVPIVNTNQNLIEANESTYEKKAVFYNDAIDKLNTLNKLYSLSSSGTERPLTINNINDARGTKSAPDVTNNSLNVSAFKSGLDIEKNIAKDNSLYSVSSAGEQSTWDKNVTSGITPRREPIDVKYKTADKPSPAEKPTMGVPLGMGVPITFGFNLPGPSVDPEPLQPASAAVDSKPSDQVGVHPEVVSGLEGGTFVTLSADSTVDSTMASSSQSIGSTTSNVGQSTASEQVSAGSSSNIQRSMETTQNSQKTVRREPQRPISRQPIIETQPAVDFMSTFLSQPIDPTRRGDRQKTANVQTDISIVPLENQKSVGPSQTLVQDGKSRDWRSFISSFLMGGPGFDQMGGPGMDPMGGSSMDQTSGSAMDQISSQPTEQTQNPSARMMDRQMGGSTQDIIGGSAVDQTRVQVMNEMQNQPISQPAITFTPEVIDTAVKPINNEGMRQPAESVSGQSGSSFVANVGETPLGQPGDISMGQVQKPRSVIQDQINVKNTAPIGDRVIDFKDPFVNSKPFQGPDSGNTGAQNIMPSPGRVPDRVDSAGGMQVGINTDYQVAVDPQVQNVIGLSDTRPLDVPRPAETTSISTRMTPIDSSNPVAPTPVDLGLSETPLTSFEGASNTDLQKLKLLEVAQRLLLQERGIKDPQATSQVQTFTPQGMPGSVENLLASLNQVNSMADMIKKSLTEAAAQRTNGGSTGNLLNNIKPTNAPPKNVEIGEWSSGIPVELGLGNERARLNSVPIGNIFAGRFLQSGAGLPSVKRDSITSPSDRTGGGIAIGQSLNSLPSTNQVTPRGGGFVVKNKLPLSYYQRDCRAVKDPTSRYHFFRTVGNGRIRFRCALGTAFDEDTCECSTRVYSYGNCLEVDMNFNNGKVVDVSPNELPIGNDNVEVTNRTAAYPGIAVFDGNSRLTIWRYQNYDFRDHVMITLRFRPGVGGDRYQPIITNCDGNPDGPSVGIVYDNSLNEVILILRTNNNNDKNLRFKTNPNRWTDVTYLYDGNMFIGLVNNNRQAMPTQGLVLIRDEALVLGHCPRYGRYTGAVDDVKIYTCIPKDKKHLL